MTVFRSQSQPTTTPDEFVSTGSSNSQCHQIRRLRLVRTQVFLFVMTYALCVGWCALVIFLESLTYTQAQEISVTVKYFPALVFNAIFAPLAGFLNMIVFLRPKYLRWKHGNPQNTSLRDFWHSLLAANTSRRREKGPIALPDPAERKRSDKSSPAERFDAWR
mmetsp:Transcript_13782/g.33382  ORF Transcript_13782/g.33382 Transcript_13782/m.33382 type:complete len:163 (-) Transcript_13782:429-917(-)